LLLLISSLQEQKIGREHFELFDSLPEHKILYLVFISRTRAAMFLMNFLFSTLLVM
jgi:hypothetical protein